VQKIKPNSSSFGDYLVYLRERSGHNRIKEYFTGLKISPQDGISESYYRSLENGEKLPSVDTVKKLVHILRADSNIIFQRYLKDILPDNVFKKLINPVSHENKGITLIDELEKKNKILTAHRRSLERRQMFFENVYNASDSMVDYLQRNFEVLPLVHFIYLKEGRADDEEIREICKKNGIPQAKVKGIIQAFDREKIAKVTWSKHGGESSYYVERFGKVFHLPLSEKGIAFRKQWIMTEVEYSLLQKKGTKIDSGKTFSHAVIDCLPSDERLIEIQDRLFDLLAQLNASSVNLEDKDAKPYFISITLSPRQNYGTMKTTKNIR